MNEIKALPLQWGCSRIQAATVPRRALNSACCWKRKTPLSTRDKEVKIYYYEQPFKWLAMKNSSFVQRAGVEPARRFWRHLSDFKSDVYTIPPSLHTTNIQINIEKRKFYLNYFWIWNPYCFTSCPLFPHCKGTNKELNTQVFYNI